MFIANNTIFKMYSTTHSLPDPLSIDDIIYYFCDITGTLPFWEEEGGNHTLFNIAVFTNYKSN